MTPIVQEQEQLCQEIQDLASDAASVLFVTTVHSEQAYLRNAIGTALSMVEQAIGQVGFSVQSLGSHVEQISSEQ